jgi:hypothetical protein
MPMTGWLQSPQGLMAAGAVAILVDGPLGCSIQTTLHPATGYTLGQIAHDSELLVPVEDVDGRENVNANMNRRFVRCRYSIRNGHWRGGSIGVAVKPPGAR